MLSPLHLSPTIYRTIRTALAVAGLTSLCVSVSHAALIAYEGFDYPDQVDLSGQNGGSGWITAWGVNSSGTTVAGNTPGDTNQIPSLGYVDAAGNTLVTNGGKGFYTGQLGTSQPFRDFALTGSGRGTDGTTTWISLLIVRSGPTLDNPTNIYLRGANVSFFEGNTERFGIGNASSAPDNMLSLIQGGSIPNRRPTTTPYNQLSFAVLRIDHLPGNDNAYLFVNPNLSVEPDISAADAQTIGLFSYTFNRARPFAGNTDQSGARPYAEIHVDELRIGETYADVTPYIPGITPGIDVTWVGAVNGNWDTNTANWRTNGGPLTAFADGDFARFDDTATGETNITLIDTRRPTSVTVNNDLLQYRFTGSGQLAVIGGLVKSGAGRLIVDNEGNNNVSGGVLIEAGTLQIGSGGTGGAFGASSITNDGALVVNRSDSLTLSSAISGTGSLTKLGTGTLVLGGANSYSGTTEVNGGALFLNGSLSGGGVLTTAAGTTLGGAGTAAGPLTAGGLVYPGNVNTAGTLTVGPATFNSGSSLKFDLNNSTTPGGGVNDLLQVNGDLIVDNAAIIVNFIGFPQLGVPYPIISYTGTKLGSFNPVVTGTHYTGTIDDSIPGQVSVTFSGTGATLKWNSTSSADWDLGTTPNWLNVGTSLPDVFYAGDSVLFDDSVAGVVTTINIGVPVAPAAITVNSAQNFTFMGAGRITGPATLLKQGAGMLTISNANDYTGAVTIEAGTFRAGSGTALGTGAAGTTVANGATLDVNGFNLTAEPFTVSGEGVDNKGAIVNNGPEQQSALRMLTLAGDTTFGGTGRWDMRNTGGTASINTDGNYYSIKKVGTNQISLVAVNPIDVRFGDITIEQGMFAIQTSTTQVGDQFGFLTVHGGATLGLWNLNASPLNKIINYNDGANVLNENGRSIIAGQSTLNGNLTINVLNAGTGPVLAIDGAMDGSGGITKIGVGTNVLNSVHTYTGPTVVSNGTLLVDGQIAGSSGVTVYGGVLGGVGQVSAPIVIAAAGTLAPGNAATPMAAFSAGPSLTLGGTNVMDVSKSGVITSDTIQNVGAITYGGVLRLNLSGTALAVGDSIALYTFTTASGSFSSIIPATPAPGLVWDTSQLTLDGTLWVAMASRPQASGITVAGGNMTVSGADGPPNATYRVLSATSVTTPLGSWTPFRTNTFGPDGSFSFSAPIEPGTPQRFFILSIP